ncbi:MAG: GNAT family N-acetyltransferase [Magnetococcales bacterium]|nr:GNAT family N-acetyltransferase [Magnetococcales bacterium]
MSDPAPDAPPLLPLPLSMALRRAEPADLPWILHQEGRPEFAAGIVRWSPETHQLKVRDPDVAYHLAVEPSGQPAGYAILTGLTLPHRAIYLQRIVIAAPGQGRGRIFLRLLCEEVFSRLHAHRFWLHVFPGNDRAMAVYRSLGFQVEGVMREAVLQGERYQDGVVMAMLDREFSCI